MIKGIKKIFDENDKVLKKYNSELENIKKIADDIEKKGNKNEKEIKEIVLKNIENFKSNFKNLDYKTEKGKLEIENIFKDKEKRQIIVGSLYVISKYIPEWKYIPYDTQLIGILSILDNNLVEMQTGEGKSLVSFLAGYIKSLAGFTVNIITINEYLIKRDVEDFRIFSDYLGFNVGLVLDKLDNKEKKQEYSKNIVYSTQHIIFDYLKDNMFLNKEDIMIRDYYFAIIDEIDAILIDSALTPVMVSAPKDYNPLNYIEYYALAKFILKDNENYELDEELRHVELTKKGITELEKILEIDNLYSNKNFRYLEGVQNALKVELVFKKNDYYIVKEKQIIVIDPVTGRPIEGRTFPDGIQQAIETKEFGKPLKKENKVLNNITYQNFVKLFSNFSGLSGTLETEKTEFLEVFGKEIVIIPRLQGDNKEYLDDFLFKTKEGKIEFLISYIKEINETQQPLLIGAPSVEVAEQIYSLLKKEGIDANLLTASNNEKEADIIKEAGELGKITIATSMAGRGTDIKISKEANSKGGLFVIGVERGMSRRIDNQLAGRVGRQGDKGTVLFLVSPYDNFIKKVEKSEELAGVLNNFYSSNPDNEALQATEMIVTMLKKIQTRIEEQNSKYRKYLLSYDESINKHREIFYRKRNEILVNDTIKYKVELILNILKEYILNHKKEDEGIIKVYNPFLNKNESISSSELDKYIEIILGEYNNILLKMSDKLKNDFNYILKVIILNFYDLKWSDHLSKLQDIQTELLFFSYGGKDPLVEYNKKAYETFFSLWDNININIIETLTLIAINIDKFEDKNDILLYLSQLSKKDENNDINIKTPDELKAFWFHIVNGGFVDLSIPQELRPKRKTELFILWKNILENGFEKLEY